MNADEVAAIVRACSDPADGEQIKSRDLILMLLAETAAPLSRKQFTPGHITCTGLVLAPDGERLLLVLHRRLNRWLLPGGHVESGDDRIWDAAAREVIEETGALIDEDPIPPLAGLDVHGIPAKGREPYHLHHDLVFHYRAQSDQFGLSRQVRATAWCKPADFKKYALPRNIRRAYRRLFPNPDSSWLLDS